MSVSAHKRRAPFGHINYAHRGLHTEDKSIPENSLAAFRAARDAGYGAELDVQLSSDGQVVVFHDDTLDRVCHIHGKVCDFTAAELQQMHLCHTEETIPLFTEVLKTFYGAGPLIVELKTAGKKNRELCQKTLQILRTYPGLFCIESFDPRIVYWFKKNAPDIVRGQLSMAPEEYRKNYSVAASFFLGNSLANILTRPDFNAYGIGRRPGHILRQQKKGVMLVAWTSHEAANESGNDAVIFEYYRPELTY